MKESRVSFCGCIREPEHLDYKESAHNHLVRIKKFCRTVRRHWRDNPECLLKAADDPIWKLRQPVPPDEIDLEFGEILVES